MSAAANASSSNNTFLRVGERVMVMQCTVDSEQWIVGRPFVEATFVVAQGPAQRPPLRLSTVHCSLFTVLRILASSSSASIRRGLGRMMVSETKYKR